MIQSLISAGHSESDVWGYTLSKALWYLKAIRHKEIDLIEREMLSIRLAFASGRETERTLSALRRAIG